MFALVRFYHTRRRKHFSVQGKIVKEKKPFKFERLLGDVIVCA